MQVSNRSPKSTVQRVNNIKATVISADAKIQKQSEKHWFRYTEKQDRKYEQKVSAIYSRLVTIAGNPSNNE